MPNRTATIQRSLAAVIVALCAGWYIYRTGIAIFPGAGLSDFRWSYLAAQQILAGRSPYLSTGYIYPPLPAFLLTPLAALDYVAARRLWFLLSQCFLLTAAWMLWRRLGADWLAACVIAFVWASGGAAEESLALGQPGALLTLLLAGAFFPRRFEGAAMSLGCAIKLIPGVLFLTLLMQRKWQTLFGTILLTFLLLAVPWWIVRWRLPGPGAPQSAEFLAGTPAILSWSVPSITLRILEPPGRAGKPPVSWVQGNSLETLHLSAPDRLMSVSAGGLLLIAGLIALALATGGRLDPPSVPIASAALIALALVAAPVCWTHYELLQYPGIAILIDRAIRSRRWMTLLGVLTCWAFLYNVPVAVLRDAYVSRGEWPNAPGFLYFWTSVSAAACLGIFLLALRELRSNRVRL